MRGVCVMETRTNKRKNKLPVSLIMFISLLCFISFYIGWGYGQASAYKKMHDDVTPAPKAPEHIRK
ncbi:hypothetical protein MAWWA_114 [Bacillus phage vB_BspH_Mawwa]|nr:hypothetical protein MAWWA_114 [Bacillus phage vB_BspH_Mawwa]